MTWPAAAQDGDRGLALLVRDCLATGTGRQALLLSLSRLPSECTKPHHLRLTRQALEPLTMADRARLFELGTGDLAVVWRGPAEAALRSTLRQVQALFDGIADEPASIAEVMDLPRDANRLLRVVEASVAAGQPPAPRAPAALPPLDPSGLDRLERTLNQADITRFVRCRPVCTVAAEGTRLRWDKRCLSIADIAAELAPGHDLAADPWLLRRLTRTFDRRMLALLAATDELAAAGPFAFDLNVASIVSPKFLRFDAALPSRLRGRVHLDIDAADLLADPAAFVFARDFAHGRGYRLGLREVSPLLLQVIPPERSQVDVLLLRWSADWAAWAGPSPAAVATGPMAALCGADDRAAIEWGLARGVKLFLGSAVSLR